MSKSVKKGCQYKFKQGTKKGKLCKKGCRGRYCKDHKPKKQQYLKQYYRQKQVEKKNYKLNLQLKKIKDTTDILKLPDDQQYEQQLCKLKYEAIYLTKKKLGVRKVLKYDDEEFMKKFDKVINPIPKDIIKEIDNDKVLKDWYDSCFPKKQLYFEYKGTPSQAKKKLIKLDIELSTIDNKIRDYVTIINAIKKKKDEL